MYYDVVIRCRNEMDWLPRVITSLKNQSTPPSKIILVDNGSNDGSLEHAIKEKCTIIDYDKKEFNFSYALNIGLKETSQNHALVLSAHCELAKVKSVEIMLQTLTKYQAAAVFGRQIPTVNSNAIDTRDLLTVFGREMIVYDKFPFFHNAFSLLDMSAWKEVNFDESYNGIEDRVWAKEQTSRGRKIIYEPEAVVYHEHGLNQGATIDRAKRVCRALSVLHEDEFFNLPSFD